MIRHPHSPGGSDARHYTPRPHSQWCTHYVNAESAINQNSSSSWIQDPNRPHLNVILDKKHKVKALVDSGSTICLADASILNHIADKSAVGPAISVTNCHNNRERTQGCYRATLDVDEDLPHPIKNKPINIHVANKLSSELILGTDFLKVNGAIINVRDNSVTFLPEGMAAIAKCDKPILREAVMASGEIATPYEDLTDIYQNTYMIRPIEDKIIGHMDQITLHVKIITESPMFLKPGTTVMITSGLSPAPYVPDGLYTVKDDNRVQLTMRNTDICPLVLQTNKPITGITVHLFDAEYYEEIPISKETLRTYFLSQDLDENTNTPTYNGDESTEKDISPKQHLKDIQQKLQHATSLLEASGLDPPGIREKPLHGPPPEVSRILLEQFDTKDIDRLWIPAYKELILDNYDVFSLDKFDVGHTPHYHHRIERTTDQPIYVQQFKIPVADEQALDEFATNLTAARVLVEQSSVHNTPIFMVAKRGGANVGKKRFVQDFRKQNAASQDDKYTIRDVRESLTAVGRLKPKIFSKCDFTGAFYSLPLEKSSQALTSFTLPFKNAQYSWTRMPQGLKGASASFSKLCQLIFRDIRNIVTYVDDLMAAATTHQEMLKLLERVFEECRYHGMKLNLKKCILGVMELTWLGYAINEFGISPEFDKAEAIKSMVPPKTIKEVQSHLGLFQFFSDLVENYALVAAPLGAVTSPSHPWRGEKLSGPLPQKAFQAWDQLINIISSRPAISFPDFSLPFQLHVDASVGQEHHGIRGGLGAILTQVQDGITRPIGYFSRQFRESECKYNAYNAELAGIVASLNHFHYYLKGSRTTIITDHLPIVKNGRRDDSTMHALRIKMNEMDIELLHMRGDAMPADALSRQPMAENHPGVREAKQARQDTIQAKTTSASDFGPAHPLTMSDQQWKFEQSRDTLCKEMKQYIENNRLSSIPEVKNIISLYGHKATIDQTSGLIHLFTARNRHISSKRLWVPKSLQNMILSNHHGSTLTGHNGELGTYERIQTKYFWPTMSQDISKFVRHCKVCHQMKDAKAQKNKVPLKLWKTPTHRNMRIHMDLVGPLTPSRGYKYILTITDAFTRYTELVAIPDKETTTVAKELLDQWILRHGFYEQVISDNGGEFVSNVMDELNKLLRLKHHVISPYSPHINGQVERVHKTMGDYLKEYCDNAPAEWTDFLPSLRFALNTRVHCSTKMSPYFMTYMEHPTFPWSQEQHLTYSESEIASRVLLLQHARQLISQNSDEAKAASKRAYDIKTKARKFSPGDDVLLHIPDPPEGTSRKLYMPWRGIYTIIEKTSDTKYKLKKKGGRVKSAHINRIKYYDPENSDSDKDTLISNEEDEEPPSEDTGPTTRSRDNTLPPPINRFTAMVNAHQDEFTQIARQPPMDATLLWGSNNSLSNDATFATEFRTILAQNHTNSAN